MDYITGKHFIVRHEDDDRYFMIIKTEKYYSIEVFPYLQDYESSVYVFDTLEEMVDSLHWENIPFSSITKYGKEVLKDHLEKIKEKQKICDLRH